MNKKEATQTKTRRSVLASGEAAKTRTGKSKSVNQAPSKDMVTANLSDYPRLLTEVKERVRGAQYEALKKVNSELVRLYWDIGRIIVEQQESEGWGKRVVERLSEDLRSEFPGVMGFSVQNIWYMRQFFKEYRGLEKLQPLVGEISWAHNLVILGRCKDPLEKEF